MRLYKFNKDRMKDILFDNPEKTLAELDKKTMILKQRKIMELEKSIHNIVFSSETEENCLLDSSTFFVDK